MRRRKVATISLISEIVIGILLIASMFVFTNSPEDIEKVNVSASYNTISLKWEKTDGADSYRMYKGDSNNNLSYVTTVSNNEYTDNGLETGRNYYYKIVPYNGIKRARKSYEISASTVLDTPSITSYIHEGHIKVVATKVEGATGYKLYRDDELIKTQEGTEFLDKDAKCDVEHSYAVRAYRLEGTEVDSDLSNVEKIYVHGFGDIIAKVFQRDIIIEWDTDEHYSEYIIYRNGKRLKRTKEGPFIDKKRKVDTVYEYSVVGVNENGIIEARSTKRLKIVERDWDNEDAINAACDWAVQIAGDDSFTYGSGSRARRYGCYFCGTNTGPKLKMKERSGEPHTVDGHTYEKTYCCNPFVHAAFSHGAGDPNMLEACQKGRGIGMSAGTFTRYGNWTNLGKPSYSSLKRGDVIVTKYGSSGAGHVVLYIGDGKIAEATGGTWSADSIRVKEFSSSRYNGFKFVMRYSGNGSGKGFVVEEVDENGNVVNVEGVGSSEDGEDAA